MQFLREIVLGSFKKSAKTTLWLLKLILPISLLVRLLDYAGVLAMIAEVLNPIFVYLGLPGGTAIIFITSIFLPMYAPLAIITSLTITLRELTILALMCQLSHNLPVESAIQSRTGASYWGMFALRLSCSLLVGFVLNWLLPADMGMATFAHTDAESINTLGDALMAWVVSSTKMMLLILSIVFALNVLYQLMDKYHLIEKLSNSIKQILRFFGLPKSTGFLWVIGNFVGLSYGGALMIDQMKEGKVTKSETNLLNYHLAVSHSVLEDNLLFAALGVSFWLILAVRLSLAFVVVWSRRLIGMFIRHRWQSAVQ